MGISSLCEGVHKIKHMENNIYKTKDLAEAASLLISKNTLLGVVREERVCWFVFEDRHECERLSNQYFFGELAVNAREFNEAIIRLKGYIFSR